MNDFLIPSLHFFCMPLIFYNEFVLLCHLKYEQLFKRESIDLSLMVATSLAIPKRIHCIQISKLSNSINLRSRSRLCPCPKVAKDTVHLQVYGG